MRQSHNRPLPLPQLPEEKLQSYKQSQPLCETVLRRKWGSPEEGVPYILTDVLGPWVLQERGPKGDSSQCVSRSAPDSPFNTCCAIMEGLPSSISPLQQRSAKLSQQKVLEGRCRRKGLQGERGDGKGMRTASEALPSPLAKTCCLPASSQPLHSPPSTDLGPSRLPAHTSILIPSAHSLPPPSLISCGPPDNMAFQTDTCAPASCTECPLPLHTRTSTTAARPPCLNPGGLLPVCPVTEDQ